jgi:outer membrane receptor protein involved in Fe transport
VRGGAPDEVLVLVDGFPLNDPYSGRADLRRIPSASVSRVTLEAGAQGARYGGRAISGVLAIETRRAAPSEISSWFTSRGTLGARATLGAGSATLTVGRDALIDQYEYDVPVTRGGGVAQRNNAGGAIWTLNGRWVGPADLTLRASTSERGLPGPVSSPTPSARGRDGSLLLGGRSRGEYEAKASLELLATRFEDPTPAVGPAYDSRTEGVGLTAGLARTWAPKLAGYPAPVTIGAELRHDRFAGNGNFPDAARRTLGSIRAEARVALSGGLRALPAVRLDWWTGRATPVASARLGAEAVRGRTTISLSLGSAVTPPVLADLFFREGNGVRVNPGLRPERVRWEAEGGLRHEARAGRLPIAGSLRGFAGRVDDMILWGQSPGFRFAWSPANFNVVRRGGEASLVLGPRRGLTLSGDASLSLVTRAWNSGIQVLYRPRFTSLVSAGWTAGRWSADLRWNHVGQRFPNSAGINPLAPIDLVSFGAEAALPGPLRLRADLTDLLDRRPSFIAGYPSPGRTASLTLTLGLP